MIILTFAATAEGELSSFSICILFRFKKAKTLCYGNVLFDLNLKITFVYEFHTSMKVFNPKKIFC